MENLDTDIPPPAAATEATRAAIGEDDAKNWLPFTGRDDLEEAVAAYIERRGGPRCDGRREDAGRKRAASTMSRTRMVRAPCPASR